MQAKAQDDVKVRRNKNKKGDEKVHFEANPKIKRRQTVKTARKEKQKKNHQKFH